MKIGRALVCAGLVIGVLALAPAALAGTITVTTMTDQYGGDPANCSLREAVHSANIGSGFDGCTGATAGPDTINLPAGTYGLTIAGGGENDNVTGDLDVASSITLARVSGKVVIDQTTADRVIDVFTGGNLTVTDITIQGGETTEGGGGIRNLGGTVTLTDVTITGNTAADGGGLFNDTTATLRNVTISGNQATGNGGGLYNSGTATLNNVTIAENEADSDQNGTGDGGGIFVQAGTVSISNSIVGDNRDRSTGANPRHPDCSGTVTSGGYNLIEDVGGCTIAGVAAGNITGRDPQLFPLADNGGPTPTHALRRGSDAVNAGNPAAPGSGPTSCETTDQRGVTRPQGPRCDIGAFERDEGEGEALCLGRPVTISGTPGNDVITGTPRRDVIRALGGDDVVDALRGNDFVCAGAGNDRANGRTGRDRITGQSGNDRAIGAGGDDLLRGQGGRDRLKGKGGRDTLRGGPKPDRLNGGGGFDVCAGGGGRDVLRRCERRS
jgi:CSLREA domain-containing protein